MLALAVVLTASAPPLALAQDGVTVETLLREGYEVKGVFPSNAGPGLVLENGEKVVMCFVAETPGSSAVVTQYCKPVR